MLINTRYDELMELYEYPLKDLIKISSDIKQDHFGNKVDFCSIAGAKTGKCGEDCRYCAQSSHYRTNIETHSLISLDELRKCASRAKESGVTKFSIVASGKKPEHVDFGRLVNMIAVLKEIGGFTVCASLGIINKKELMQLKEAGLDRYHHNINTCRSYYKEVCTTHSFQERLETINITKECGLEICSGVIIGMGETAEQRIETAVELAEISPDSIPVNLLYPIKGTPFEIYNKAINEEEILKTIAIIRIALPKSEIRYAGGRAFHLSSEAQELGLKAGITGMLVGNYLTTIGITPEEDKQLLAKSGMELVIS